MPAAMYQDLAATLRGAIADGSFPPGSRLPSEHEVSERYGASRNTVRRAFAALSQDGLISSHQGARRIVLAEPRVQSFSELRSFSRWARSIGEVPSGRVVLLERRVATGAEVQQLALTAGEQVVYLVRLRLLSGRPVMIERTAYADRAGSLLGFVDLERESVCERLEEYGIFFAHAQHTIDAVNASAEDAALLETGPGAALLRERRRTTDHDGRPLEWSEDVYRGDAVAFSIRNSLGAAPLARDHVKKDRS